MKNILITGVSSGIGYDAVGHFTALGYRVFGSVRSQNDAERLREEFPHLICLEFDVTDRVKIEHARQEVVRILEGEPLTALVNNAGYALGGPLALLSDDAFSKQLEVNVLGVRYVTNAFLPLLGACTAFAHKPGKVINISSISGVLNTPMNGAYCVSKHALESMMEVYRREMKRYGIQFVSIQPGPIQSKLWEKNTNTLEAYLDTDYGVMAQKTSRIIQQAEKEALPARRVSLLIEKVINSKRPKLAYILHSRRLPIWFMVKVFPKRFVDFILSKALSE